VGQLVAGFLLRNVPAVGEAVGAAVGSQVSAAIRTSALGVAGRTSLASSSNAI